MRLVAALVSAAGLLLAAALGSAHAQQSSLPLKIGVLTDLSSVYSDIGGLGNIEATKMAIEDFGGVMFGKPIELVSADVLNKADIAASFARKWWENEGVDMIIDMPTSATALAVMELSKQYEKIVIITDAASSDITGKSCSPYTAHWTYDTYANAHAVGGAIVKNGGDTWFFITADYVFGHSIERDTSKVVEAAGGKVLGSARHPLNSSDFSSLLLQAQASKAKIIGLANAGGDAINVIKQGGEFGIVAGGQNFAAIVMFISDVHSLGPESRAGADRHRSLLLGFERRHPRLRQALLRAHEADADDEPGVNLQRDAALSEGGSGHRHARYQDRHGQDARNPGARCLHPERHAARRRPHGPQHVSVPGEEAGRVDGPLGLLQAPRRGPRRSSLPAAQGRRVFVS